jgi:hypothetical protein
MKEENGMRSLAPLLLIVLCLTACSAGHPIGTLPKVSNLDEMADVMIIRERGFVGGAMGLLVSLDGQDIFLIGNGDFTKFRLDPGRYSLSAGIEKRWFRKCTEGKLNVRLQPRSKYFFLLQFAPEKCVKIELVGEKRGLEIISGGTFIPPTQ